MQFCLAGRWLSHITEDVWLFLLFGVKRILLLTGIMLAILGLTHVYCCNFPQFWAGFLQVVQFYWLLRTLRNIRTCCEYRAKHIWVVCRKRNLTCPRVVSWFIDQARILLHLHDVFSRSCLVASLFVKIRKCKKVFVCFLLSRKIPASQLVMV